MSEGNVQAGTLPPSPEHTSSFKMISSLGAAGAAAGLLIVLVFGVTKEPIERYKAEVLRLAVSEVLNDPARYETLYVTSDGAIEASVPAGTESEAKKIYVGFDADGHATGVAVKDGAAGFQDIITLIYGFDPTSGKLLAMKVLENKETPGLGDAIEKDLAFVSQFEQATPPLAAVKRSTGAPGEIDAITGATISSRAVVRIINESLARLRAPIEAYFSQASAREEALP